MDSMSREPTPEAIAAQYDNLDRFYLEIWGEHVHHGFWESGKESPEEAVLHLSHRMAQLAQVGRGDEVLDVRPPERKTQKLNALIPGKAISRAPTKTGRR
jgi:tocopherol O-methyltransferase